MRQLTLKHHFTAKDVDNQTDSRFRISEFQGRVVILCSNKFFLYNDLDNKLVPFEMLNKSGTSHSAISKLIELDHNTCWIVETDAVSLYDFSKSEGKLVTQCHYAKNISSIDSYENVVRANDSTSLICLVNGVILYKHTIDLNAKQEKPVLSLSLALAKGRDNSVDTLDIMSNQPISIPYNRNHVVLEFSCPSTVNRPSYFQYKLEGLSDQWSTPTRNYALDFERLPSGKYTFLLRIANSESDPVLRYSFRITPPWYRSIYALLVYLIALSAAIWISWRLLLHQEHKRYLMRMRSREEERIRKHNAILRQVVKNKNTELFNVTANAIQKNQVLNGIKAEMEKFVTSHPNTQIASKLDKISKSINYNKLAEEDWKLFVMHFEQTHEHFFKDVKDLHPTLTAGDLKLCACLKLNLSTKEIASLLSISIRGVEIGRYRLRKKINLASDINLNDYFIKNF